MEDIKAIRNMMERSVKFLNFSNLSIIIAGIAAIVGAAFAYFYLLRDPSLTNFSHKQEILILVLDAVAVLLVAIGFGFFLSWRKSKKNRQKLFNKVMMRTLYNFSIPLLTGGVFCVIFLLRGDIAIVISGTLIFYGLALINASKYTYSEIHYLGLTEVLLGLLSAIFLHQGILFWSLGFGLCHIIFGLVLHFKYDRKKSHE